MKSARVWEERKLCGVVDEVAFEGGADYVGKVPAKGICEVKILNGLGAEGLPFNSGGIGSCAGALACKTQAMTVGFPWRFSFSLCPLLHSFPSVT